MDMVCNPATFGGHFVSCRRGPIPTSKVLIAGRAVPAGDALIISVLLGSTSNATGTVSVTDAAPTRIRWTAVRPTAVVATAR